MTHAFVHLRLHTEYSLVDGVVRIGPLMRAAAEAGMPAIALTDYGNLFAMVKFCKAAIRQGLKPLVGVNAVVRHQGDSEQRTDLVLLCQDQAGYRNLTRLISRSYLEGQHGGVPMIEQDWLDGATDGLIALSGGRDSDIGRALLAGKLDVAGEALAAWGRLFPERFYLELIRTGRPGEEDYLHAAVALAEQRGTPVVATNDVRFIAREDFEAHEARVCIHDGRTLADPRRPRNYSEQQHLRGPEEMAELFADLPEALDNAVEIAKRCNFVPTLGEYVLPEYPIPDGLSVEAYFCAQAREGLERRLQVLLDPDAANFTETRRPYDERLEVELEVINQMGFPGYFLIVADFIQWAKKNGIPVGPGRGSGAGSLVAYALEITDLDPLAYDLLFERFLNPERVSMPDFDVDFCMEQRDRVIDYVAQKYGRDRVSQIITHGTMAAKAVVRDVGRVLGHPYGFVDRIAKLIPFEIGMTLEKALDQEEDLRKAYDEEEEVRAILDLARSLEGLARNAGKHAGGVVIAPDALTEFTPLYCEQGGQGLVTQLDKDDVEAIGLVKFDFLGLRTLTIIDWAVEAINRQRGARREDPLRIERIPMDDPAAFELLKRQETTAVFQLESRGMKDLIKRLQPDVFDDIVALVALYRPGPLQSGMVDDFINRKHGIAKVEYPHPALEPILQPTYGVILYQEQVMQIAQVLAGYSLGGADLLRRAMGKKKPEEMAKQRAVFLDGAKANGVDDATATYIFDLMEKFAGYGFNKSHSAAYALLSYQTAWLKAHHPAAFMAAVLSADMDNTDKVVNLIDECRSMGLDVIPPDVNVSAYAFEGRGDKAIVYGLGAIKGVGEGAIAGVIEQRGQDGPFEDLDSLCRRVDAQKVNRRVLEALIKAGALDSIGPNRASLMARLPEAVRLADQHQRDVSAGQDDLFGGASTPAEQIAAPMLAEWEEEQRLALEKETLGLYLTGHPITKYLDELRHIASARIAELAVDPAPAGNGGYGRRKEQDAVVAGLVVAFRTKTAASGRQAFVSLDDQSGRIEIALFAETYQRYGHLLIKDKLLVVEGGLAHDDYSGGLRLRVRQAFDIDQARAHFANRLEIRVAREQAANGFVPELQHTLEPFREGGCPVIVSYHNGSARAELRLGDGWRVNPTDELIHRLRQLVGESNVAVRYN
jgi:DNA polymerase-3 subunit alpha